MPNEPKPQMPSEPRDPRCLRCARPRSAHGDNLKCPTQNTLFASRDLPPGMTCADCRFYEHTCKWLISYTGKETACDWYPVKFYPKELVRAR
jgi:hypothetical protein